eukprot:TRINITY_DN122252_c0_g1_i1.p1 TRINITY_DN122252_c0_g1~~TRINITY_DN122252_c0_g1_i1.p1  ORF type:complete len:376 (+),score=75.47 TRINITY_DN122252_c0_g1_i1:226-1353(+)
MGCGGSKGSKDAAVHLELQSVRAENEKLRNEVRRLQTQLQAESLAAASAARAAAAEKAVRAASTAVVHEPLGNIGVAPHGHGDAGNQLPVGGNREAGSFASSSPPAVRSPPEAQATTSPVPLQEASPFTAFSPGQGSTPPLHVTSVAPTPAVAPPGHGLGAVPTRATIQEETIAGTFLPASAAARDDVLDGAASAVPPNPPVPPLPPPSEDVTPPPNMPPSSPGADNEVALEDGCPAIADCPGTPGQPQEGLAGKENDPGFDFVIGSPLSNLGSSTVAVDEKVLSSTSYSYTVAGKQHAKEELGACMLCLEPLQNDPREVVNLCSAEPRCLCLIHQRCFLNPQYEMSDALRRCMICKTPADKALVRRAVQARARR